MKPDDETTGAVPLMPPEPPAASSPGREWLAEKDRTMNLQGKAYLQVADRVTAFRLDHPDWSIVTEFVEGNFTSNLVVFRATIYNPEGRVVATGHKAEVPPTNARGCQDWFEKAETGAIGRALGNLGYGTNLALDEAPERPCDAPRPRPELQSRPPQATPRAAAAAPKPPVPDKTEEPAAPGPDCVACGKPVNHPGRVKWCQTKGLPPSHPEPACANDEKAKTSIQKGG